MSKNCIIIFVKYPEKGKVKSRLAKDIGDEFATNLYKCFVHDLLALLSKMNLPFKIAFYPNESEKEIKLWLGNELDYLVQKGNDLGERMKNAFKDTFNMGFEKVILIGSDSPDLHAEIFLDGFHYLEKTDAVIGPALDGGYYLIGFDKNKFLPAIFNNLKWSAEYVFKDTIKIFKYHNYNIHKLTEWGDIDTFEDLKTLFENNKNRNFSNSKTINFLLNNKIFSQNND